MLTLTLDGQVVDLPTDADLSLTFRAADLSNLESRESGFSETFTLPLTARNVRVLDTPHSLDSTSRTPYRRLAAVLAQNDVEVLNGYGLLQRAAQGYEILLLQGAGSLMAEVSEKSLRELNLGQYDHALTFDNAAASQTNLDGYTYPFADKGTWYYRAPADRLLFEELPHVVYSSTVLRQIVAEALPGYTVGGSLLEEPRFQQHVLPMATSWPQLRKTYLDEQKASAEKDNEQAVAAPGRGFEGAILTFLAEVKDPGQHLRQAPFETAYQMPGFGADCQVTAVLYLDLDGPNVQKGSGSFPKASIRVIDSATDSVVGESVLYEGEWEAGYTVRRRTVEIDFTIAHARPGSQLRVQAYVRDGLRLLVHAESEVAFTLLPRVYRDGPVHLDASLPDISQADFLLLLANQFNVLLQTDVATRTVRADLFNDLEKKRPQALDWTSKVDFSQRPALTFALPGYAQRNTLAYDAPPAAYKTLPGLRRPGKGAILVENLTLEKEREAYAAPVALVQSRGRAYDATRLPWLPLVETGLGPDTPFPFAATTRYHNAFTAVLYEGRVWRVSEKIFAPQAFRGGDFPPRAPRPGEKEPKWFERVESEVYTSGQDSLPTVALLTPNPTTGYLVGEDSPSSRTFAPASTLTRQGLAFDSDLLPAYYPVLQQLLRRTVVLECFLRLRPTDIAALDFTVPIRLNVVHWPGYGSLQGDFYLQLIDQYEPGSTGPVRCELVALGGPVVTQASLSGGRKRVWEYTFGPEFG